MRASPLTPFLGRPRLKKASFCQPDGLTAAAEGTQNTICCGHPWVPSIMLFAIDGVSVRPQNSCEASIWRDLDLLKCYRSRQEQTVLNPQTTNPGSGCRWPHG
eukprot:gene20118-biopygen14608